MPETDWKVKMNVCVCSFQSDVRFWAQDLPRWRYISFVAF